MSESCVQCGSELDCHVCDGEKNKWQDIQTAPTGGNRILIFDGVDMYVASWGDCDNSGGKGWVYSVGVTDYNSFEVVYNATHWMPLPDKPI